MLSINSTDKFEHTRCPLCGSNNHSLVFEGIDRKLRVSKERFRVVKCQSCGLIFNNPRLKEKFLSEYYPRAYSPYQVFKTNLKRNLLYQILDSIVDFKRCIMFRHIARLSEEHDGKLLDVGCGNGKLLYVVKKMGMKVYGVEPDKDCWEYVTKNLGIEAYNGTLMDVSFPDSFFDVVIFRHSFEHLMNPNEVLKEVHRIIKKEGTLVIILPNAGSVEARLFRERWSGFDLPRHICHYTRKTIGAVMERNDFKVITIRLLLPTTLPESIQYLFLGTLILGKSLRKVTYLLSLFISWLLYPLFGGSIVEVHAKKKQFSAFRDLPAHEP